MSKKISDLDQLSADQAADAAETRYKPDWSREDRPTYGNMGPAAHENLYEGWRSSSKIPNLPSWKEMDNNSRSAWMTSSHGSKIVNQARRQFNQSNFSEKAGRAVVTSSNPERPNMAVEVAGRRVKNGLLKAASSESAPTIDASRATEISSAYALNNDYSHHHNLGAVVDKLEAAHNGSNSSVPALASAARKSISDSIYAHGLGKREDSMSHFTQAAGHVMRLAQAVNGAASNAGSGGAAVASGMAEANTHLTNYRNMVSGIKKVN